MKFSILTNLFWLLIAHACTDVWWQDERMIGRKHRYHLYSGSSPDPETPERLYTGKGGQWIPWMLAHALINGAGVALVTHSAWLGIAETIVHGVTDTLKCEHKIGLATDQIIHLASKVTWGILT